MGSSQITFAIFGCVALELTLFSWDGSSCRRTNQVDKCLLQHSRENSNKANPPPA